MHDLTESDIQYTALPLYHSAGGNFAKLKLN